ncbi:MAG: YigZ family protein [Stomatobaculum sp.]|nr:YigZ family protein [Stomatobaculum sp.]
MANTKQPVFLCIRGGSAEVTEKRSRFIGQTLPVQTEEEAQAFIARIRKENHDARHNCYAYITGPDGSVEKCSDDGEPSRTAGMPMMDLLKKRNLRNICVVVTRYFGGILLGTGGLVRCYSAAAQEALDNSLVAERRKGTVTVWETDYGFYGKLQYLASEEELPVLSEEFEEKVTVTLLLPEEKAGRIRKTILEMSAGKLTPVEEHPAEYCSVQGVTRIL